MQDEVPRRVDPALFGHPRQHLAVAFAVVAPHDRAQRRIGLHRRAVDASVAAAAPRKTSAAPSATESGRFFSLRTFPLRARLAKQSLLLGLDDPS